MNWENKLVCYATNVGLSYCNDCCSTTSHNEFLIILLLFGATLLSSYEMDLILILIKFVCRILVRVKNTCIDCKDCAFISIGFCSSMKVFDQD